MYRALAVDREYRVIFLDDNQHYFARHGSLYKNGQWRLFKMRRRNGEWRTEPNASKLLRSSDPALRRGWVRHDKLAYDLLCAARRAADRIAADPIDSTFEIVQSATRRYFVRKRPTRKASAIFTRSRRTALSGSGASARASTSAT